MPGNSASRSLASALIYGVPAGVVAWGWQERGWTRIYSDVGDFPLWWLPLSVLLYLATHDTWFYWTHRWMHRPRLFRMSLDPYQCPDPRPPAEGSKLASCPDTETKRRWYDAEQGLRNQIDRTYEARMDFSLRELEAGAPGSGPASPPDIDTLRWLQTAARASGGNGSSGLRAR